MSNENTVNSNMQAAEEKTNSKLWEDIDSEKVRGEFKKMSNDLSAFGAEMEKLAKDKNNFDKTKESLETLRDKDFSASGWIQSFINENTSAFPGLNGDGSKKASKPDWYYVLLPDKRKKYDDILDYMDDAVKLKKFFKPFSDILTRIPLKDTFRVFAIIKNMKTKGWSTGEYQPINKDIESILDLIKLSWSEMNNAATLSERFYKEHVSQMDSPKMKEGYIKQRQEDYNNIFKKYAFYKSCNYRGNGKYGVLAERIACMKTLDTYMGLLVKNKDLDDRLKTLLASVEDLASSLMSNIVLHTGAGQDLHRAMVNLIVVIRFYLTCGLEEFTKFKTGSDEAPYCYMKCPKAAEQAAGYFGFAPAWGDSWDKGTGYYEIYRKILFAIMEQSRDFTYVHGRVH